MKIVLFIIGGIVLWAFISGFARGKARQHYAKQQAAMRAVHKGKKVFPSWMADTEKNIEFLNSVEEFIEYKEGIPKLVSAAILSNEEVQRNLMYLAGEMEENGSSFTEQQMAVAEALIQLMRNAR